MLTQGWKMDLQKQPKCRKVPIETLATNHNISLPKPEDLPPSYTLRRWVTRKIATLQGRRKEEWQRIKSNPIKMQQHRESTRIRMQLSRQRGGRRL